LGELITCIPLFRGSFTPNPFTKASQSIRQTAILAQVGAIVAAIMIAPLIASFIQKRVFLFRDEPAEDAKFLAVRKVIFTARHFLRAVILVLLLALFAACLKAVPALGQDWLVKIAQSLATVFLLYRAIKTYASDPLIRKVLLWTLIPLSLVVSFGYLDDLVGFLEGAVVFKIGEAPISLMSLVRLGIFGSLFFWLGGISNKRGQGEIVAKLFQIILFVILTILVMGAADIPLSGLVVVFSAVALGIGFGLQPIAANFVSGLIILFDRSVRVGDFVVLPDGQEGFVEAINMRNTVVETTDGKDIMVPNTKFTEDAYENWTHKDPRQRYEVHFTVAYDTDLDALEDLIIPEFLKHPSVLKEPEMPDLEFREFGDHGAKMAVEFWCSGIDDGPNKFTSDLNFIVWRILRDNKIEIPFPQLVVHKK